MTVIIPYSKEWWQARRGKITASTRLIIAVFGSAKEKNAMLDEMKAELQPDFVHTHETNQYMEWGHKHEPVAKRHIEFMYDLDTYEPGFLVHPTCNILAATPDWEAMVDAWGTTRGAAKITGEIKCPFFLRNHMKLSMGLATNKKYEVQVQGQLLVTGADVAWFFSFHPDAPHDIQLYREIVEPDRKLHQRMLESCAEMQAMLQADRRFSDKPVRRDDTGIPQLF